MARVTVEDCLDHVDNRFELVLVASKRARQLARQGMEPTVEWDNDKPTVVALREIAVGHGWYHQPVTRADIEQIRGVSNNSQILRTLFDWNWIKEAGFRDLPGRPALLITTPQFLNAFGLASLGQLPPLQNAKEAFMALDANAPKS